MAGASHRRRHDRFSLSVTAASGVERRTRKLGGANRIEPHARKLKNIGCSNNSKPWVCFVMLEGKPAA